MSKWISFKDKLPPWDARNRIAFVLAFHTVHGAGVAWVWVFEGDGRRKELEEDFKDKYLCSAHFVDENYNIYHNDDINIFLGGSHFEDLGTISHWMPLPKPPKRAKDEKNSGLTTCSPLPKDILERLTRDMLN